MALVTTKLLLLQDVFTNVNTWKRMGQEEKKKKEEVVYIITRTGSNLNMVSANYFSKKFFDAC